jgi:acetolactate synthase I/II/III large subunit
MTHPRGPVFLNCPADATRGSSPEPATPRAPQLIDQAVASPAAVSHAHGVLSAARRPIALVGRGILNEGAAAALASFVSAWQIPFFATYKAKGCITEHDPLCLGAVALSPVFDDLALGLIREADAIVMIGFDPIELRDGWLDAVPAVPTVTVEYTPQTHRIFDTGRQIIGDIPLILAQLSAHPKPSRAWTPARLSQLRQAVAHVIRPREPKGRISPSALFHAVSRRVTSDLLMTVDVGAHRILANHVLQCKTPGQLLQSNGLGHMGYAIPAAIGAALAAQKPVIAMLGDGCALMSLGELALVAERQCPIVSIILVDNDLALIDLKQDKLKMARQAVGFASPDFGLLARGFGLAASDVSGIAEFEAALDAALASGRPHVIAAKVDPAEYWEQM